MQCQATPIRGVFVLDLERRGDERGYFARAWCAQELASFGLQTQVAQINVGFSRERGTLRGLHYQLPPAAEVKLVRCTRGAVWDAALDLRRDSPTFGRWFGCELSAENARQLYLPPGCAHGYQTLEADSEICYLTSQPYAPDLSRGVRYDDPQAAIAWPLAVTMVSDADRHWPLLRDVAPLVIP